MTADGVAATCFHVVEPARDLKEGCLVAVDEAGKVLPVVELLAANRESDAAIVRIAGSGFTPLALNTNVYPGDAAYCYSDPLDNRDYFSAGIVNRFYRPAGSRSPGTRADRVPRGRHRAGRAAVDQDSQVAPRFRPKSA